jgi:hypothetical protein
MTGRRASSTRIRRSRLRRCTVLPAGTQVLGPQAIGRLSRSCWARKRKIIAMKPDRSCAQYSAFSYEPLHSSKGAEQLIPDVDAIEQRTRPVVHRETPSGRDPCKQRPLLGPGWGGYLPLTRSSHIPFHDPAPQGSGAAGRAAARCPTRGRGRTLSWTHRARGPRSGAQDLPEGDCESGRHSRHR